MGRTPGAKNKTAREHRLEAKLHTQKASFLEKLAAERAKTKAAKAAKKAK